MKMLLSLAIVAMAVTACAEPTNSVTSTNDSGTTVETIACIRHGEKPAGGLGQLNCRGLNRALALPDVLLKKYGTPQFVFAPNPTQKVDGKKGYYYVRPLMTIEPTAIRCGLPVNTQFGYREVKGLESELQADQYQNATIFIAWEHGLLDQFAKNIVKSNGGDVKQVPGWPGPDFDTIFLFKITRSGGHKSIVFTIDHENLNGLSDECPTVNHPPADAAK